MANRVTKELVLMARKHFESRGEYPSEQKISKFVGFGSDGTIHRLNNEILAEKRMEGLNRSVYMPPELPALWLASAASRADEMNAVITKELEEKDCSLQAAIDQLEELKKQKSALEDKATTMQAAHLEINDSIHNERTAHATTESSLTATISEQAKSVENVTSERDKLLKKNEQLMIEQARHQEATKHHTEEVNQLKTSAKRMQEELEEERGKTAIAVEQVKWLTNSLDQRTDEVKELFKLEHNLIEQFTILKESLLSNETTSKSPTTSRSKNASKPQANA